MTNGTVKNIGIGENCNITGGAATSGIIGYMYNNSVITNAYNKADIIGMGTNTGGITGCAYIDCKIINVYNNGNIKNDNTYYIGGIVGICIGNIVIENCFNEEEVNGENSVGGICGTTNEGTNINQCYNIGMINATYMNDYGNSNTGGIVGLNYARVTNCYNKGSITGKFDNIGGIIGCNIGLLRNSYNVGNVGNDADKTGAITGNNQIANEVNDITYIGTIENCYSLTGVAEKLIGSNTSTVGEECSFKDSNDLMQLYTILGEAFKQDLEKINQGYPILEWQ